MELVIKFEGYTVGKPSIVHVSCSLLFNLFFITLLQSAPHNKFIVIACILYNNLRRNIRIALVHNSVRILLIPSVSGSNDDAEKTLYSN